MRKNRVVLAMLLFVMVAVFAVTRVAKTAMGQASAQALPADKPKYDNPHQVGPHAYNPVIIKPNNVAKDKAMYGRGAVVFDFDASVFSAKPGRRRAIQVRVIEAGTHKEVGFHRFDEFVLDGKKIKKDHFVWGFPLPPGRYTARIECVDRTPVIGADGVLNTDGMIDVCKSYHAVVSKQLP